ncbi:Outer-membrane lipoprotein carrier protein [Bienertia sinuspersici]
MEKIPELKTLPVPLSSASLIVGNKVISAKDQLNRSKGRGGTQELDFPVPTRPWKGKNSLQEQDELMSDVITSNRSVDSVDDGGGSGSFSGASHPPEPVDSDLMRPVYVPISQKKPDSGTLVKSMSVNSVKGPFIDDLSIQVPPKKPSSVILSPAESLAEEPHDLNAVSSPFMVPRASQKTEASLPPDTDEKECVWDASLPPSGNEF